MLKVINTIGKWSGLNRVLYVRLPEKENPILYVTFLPKLPISVAFKFGNSGLSCSCGVEEYEEPHKLSFKTALEAGICLSIIECDVQISAFSLFEVELRTYRSFYELKQVFKYPQFAKTRIKGWFTRFFTYNGDLID